MSSGFYWTCVAVEGGIVVLCLAAVYGIGWFSATDPTARQDTAGSGPDDLGSPDWIPEQGRDERALHH